MGHEPRSVSNAEAILEGRSLEALIDEAWALRDDDPVRCRGLAEEALEAAGDDGAGRARALITLGFLAHRENLYDRALIQAFEALQRLEPFPLEPWTPRLLNVIAVCYLHLGERAQALEFRQRHLEWVQKSGSEDDMFTAYHNFGFYYASHADNVRALGYYEQARAYIGNDQNREAFLEMSLAHLHVSEDKLEQAQQHAARALELSRRGQMSRTTRFALSALADILLKRGDYAGALSVYQDVFKLSEKMREPPGEFFLSVANIHLLAGNLVEAQAKLDRAFAMLGETGDMRMLLECHRLFCLLYKEQRAFEKALHHSEEFNKLYETVFNEASEVRVRALEVTHRIDSLRQESLLLQQKNAALEAHVEELAVLHEQVRELSIRDPLTGLYNRRHLIEQAKALANLSRRQQQSISIAMLDVDHFKAINDSYGHMFGDAVLKRVAEVLQDTLRGSDLISRYGGEEFVVVMPDTPLESAVLTCERLRRRISKLVWSGMSQELEVTVSIGVAIATVATDDALFAGADEQLYRAKRSGRNRVCSLLPVT